ncbi:unnamed protein product [Bursaphelenchus okinawaensis]|uniref:Uncharacterized protein n=1 Tax=Bursaphelenchus okinawaensis TaxID=465554 RepID=A0A811KGE4_9BILA|nr:unnamed protein product [Bursaphelenchus okinawaensis]CAG9101772.1 unnamed protein product [Bursaphelenchus okinawaensis]
MKVVDFVDNRIIFQYDIKDCLQWFLNADIANSIQSTVLILIVLVLPLQPVLRFYNLKSKPLSAMKIDMMFIICIVIAIAYGILSYKTALVGDNTPAYPFLLQHSAFGDIVVYDLQLKIAKANLCVMMLLVTLAYTLTIYFTVKTQNLMRNMHEEISKETKRLQDRMKKIIIVQSACSV